ncbi:MAG: cbb3-type cytochrome c oxidase subunit I [Bacteroidetes bacterium]|nr:cbb3-type cytochrome c oxidase subunit I [Bacteroidota bacterium]MBS1634204.1 cbb3-type cytochrome c oxidase subunit I [Bacteroidota bacterium]
MSNFRKYSFLHSDNRAAKIFLLLALSYLLTGLLFGILGGLQYIFPAFLKDSLSFQKTRPLHVYLVITWIFTAAQAGIYYYLPKIAKRSIYWQNGIWLHFALQAINSLIIIAGFFSGSFGGREYLEFPPVLGGLILLSWVPFVINFFATLKPNFKTAPVYIWMWSTGILFFFITVSESYLWLFDFFRNNIVRDITVQWKALGSMVGSWNMLVYGTGIYLMEQLSGNEKASRSRLSFFFYFLGLTNLMFNWGHHTYIVPAAPWVKTVAYVISMTELLLYGYIILQWKKTVSDARKNYHILTYRLLSIADIWIFLNLTLAIAISIPALNLYTHGTHITVAHAMGTTIGINTMLLMASVTYILKKESAFAFKLNRKWLSRGIYITNVSLLIFWSSLLASGIVKIFGKINNETFFYIMQKSQPFFKLFAYSGICVFIGLGILIAITFKIALRKKQFDAIISQQHVTAGPAQIINLKE